MNKKVLTAIALGLGGLVVALTLTLSAFAIAGQEISQPARVPVFTPAPTTAGPSGEAEQSRSPRTEPGASPTPSADDHGVNSGEGSTDQGSSGSSSGGGGDDHSSSGTSSDEGEHEDD